MKQATQAHGSRKPRCLAGTAGTREGSQTTARSHRNRERSCPQSKRYQRPQPDGRTCVSGLTSSCYPTDDFPSAVAEAALLRQRGCGEKCSGVKLRSKQVHMANDSSLRTVSPVPTTRYTSPIPLSSAHSQSARSDVCLAQTNQCSAPHEIRRASWCEDTQV